jgi:hypothetical protein
LLSELITTQQRSGEPKSRRFARQATRQQAREQARRAWIKVQWFARLSGALAFVGAAAATLGLPNVAFAQSKPSADSTKPHEIAVYVEGSKAAEVREEILSILPNTTHAIDAGQFRDLLVKAGQKVPVGVPLTMSKQRVPVLSRFGKAATNASAEAIVIGVVKPGKGGSRDVLILWVKADGGDPLVEKTIPLNGSEKDAIAKALDTQLAPMKTGMPATTPGTPGTPDTTAPAGSGTGSTTSPAAGTGTKDTDTGGSSDQSARPKNTHGREILNAFLAFDLGGRFFKYHQPLTSNLRSYNVFGAPAIALAAEVYPMAMLKTPVIQGLGIVGDFRIALGLGSKTKEGTKVGTSWNRFDVGLRYRQALAKIEKKGDKAVVLGLKGTFGRDAFTLTTTDATLGAETPSVSYLFMRIGLDGEFPAGPVLLVLRGGYLGAFSAGEVDKRFQADAKQHPALGSPSLGGIDIGGGITVPIVAGFEMRFTGEYDRWFYAFHPKPTDAHIAGGAVDQNIHLELGPGYVF